jgi:hypothetical protein
MTLEHLQLEEGLDCTVIRLAIVHGKHDYKIQGFHRLLFSIADQAMGVLFTGKGVEHSYTNAKNCPVYPKIPGTRFSSVGAQPSGRSCAESPWGQGSYRPKGVTGIIFSWFVVAQRPWGFIRKYSEPGFLV